MCVSVCGGWVGTGKTDLRWLIFLPWDCQSKKLISRMNSADQHQHIVSNVIRVGNDDGDEDHDDDGPLVFHINTSTLEIFFFFFLVLLSLIPSTVSWPESASLLQCPTAEPLNLQFTLCPALQRSRAYNNCCLFPFMTGLLPVSTVIQAC